MGWAPRAFGELADYHNGAAFKPKDWGEEGLPIIRIEQLNDEDAAVDKFGGLLLPNNHIDDGDLIFSWSATLKVIIWNRGPGALNQHLYKVVPKSGVDRYFLRHLIDYNIESLALHSQGSTMKHVTRKDLARYVAFIPVVPKEQEEISRVLNAIDSTIEKTEALIAKYQQIKVGLMHDLFSRGVTANGQLRPPREQAPELYQETPIGWVPMEWEIRKIGDVFEIQLGKMLSKVARTGKWTAPYLGNRAVQWDFVDCEALEEMDFSPCEREKFTLLQGDLLVCEGGDVGRTAMWRGEVDGCYYQKAIHRLRPKHGLALPVYMLRFMRFAKERGLFREFTSQSSIAHLTQEKLGASPMLLPDVTEQARIAERIDAIDGLILSEQASLAKFNSGKVGLMHYLLTGKVRVPLDTPVPEPAHV